MFDLIIHNGRVVDYKNHLDQVTDIAVKDGRIASIGTALGKAKSHLDAKNLLVIPGIVDSHMHASSWLGGPDSLKMLALAGVTTAIEMAGPVDSVKKFTLLSKIICSLTLASTFTVNPGPRKLKVINKPLLIK